MEEIIKRELRIRKINIYEVNIEHIVIIFEALLRDKKLEEKSTAELIDRAFEFYVWVCGTKGYNK